MLIRRFRLSYNTGFSLPSCLCLLALFLLIPLPDCAVSSGRAREPASFHPNAFAALGHEYHSQLLHQVVPYQPHSSASQFPHFLHKSHHRRKPFLGPLGPETNSVAWFLKYFATLRAKERASDLKKNYYSLDNKNHSAIDHHSFSQSSKFNRTLSSAKTKRYATHHNPLFKNSHFLRKDGKFILTVTLINICMNCNL